MTRAWLAVLVFAVLGCGKDGGNGGPDASGGGDDDAPPIDAAIPEGWSPLISRGWSLGTGQESYRCKRIMVTENMWISGFKVTAPLGTHHTVLTISDTGTQTGDYDCGAGSLDMKMLYAAGVATDDLLFPDGVAIQLSAGQYINLNLHLFNLSDNPINGDSGILIKKVPQADVVHLADMTFVGTFHIDIAPDNAAHTAQGGCSAPADWHVFTLWPHMHQYANHQKLEVTHASTTATLLDDGYQFSEQKNYPMAETLIHQGDTIRTTCTYVNNSGVTDPPAHVVNFGDSSRQEMCFTGMYKWPASTNCPPQGCLFQCASN